MGDRPKDWRKSREYRRLRGSLEDSLTARGLTEAAYQDKVQEYLDFWVRRKELQADIADRGLTVIDDRGRISENRSVSLEIQVSRQMLAIFTALGFKETKSGPNWADGDDEL